VLLTKLVSGRLMSQAAEESDIESIHHDSITNSRHSPTKNLSCCVQCMPGLRYWLPRNNRSRGEEIVMKMTVW